MPAPWVVGTWRLQSWEARTRDGQVRYPMGRDAVGYLTYTDDGFMFAAMMRPDRVRFAGADLFGGTTEQKAATVDTYLTYCGRYEVREDTVIHRIELRLFPNWVGVDQVRYVELKGDRLTITPPQLQVGDSPSTAWSGSGHGRLARHHRQDGRPAEHHAAIRPSPVRE